MPIVDVWLEYKRLYELWGNQQRVADAKGVNQATVALRLQFASFPQAILNSFITNDFLKEGHAREIRQLLHCNNLSPWLTRDAAMLEVLQSVIAKYGKDVTAKHIAAWVVAVPTDPAHSTILGPSRPRRSYSMPQPPTARPAPDSAGSVGLKTQVVLCCCHPARAGIAGIGHQRASSNHHLCGG